MKKKLVAGILIMCMAMALSACGEKTEDIKPAETPNIQGETPIETPPQENREKTLSDFVTMTNVTIAPIEIYSASVDAHEPTQGYVIEATVSNENDISCDVSAEFSATITDKDNYGKERDRTHVLPELSSPYCYENIYGMSSDSVGLAPHETKIVRYYTGSSFAFKSNDSLAPEFVDAISVTDIKLLSLSAKEADVIYIPVAEWAKNVKMEEVKLESSIENSMGNVLLGTVVNNTKDKWKDGSMQFEMTVNGQTFNTPAIKRLYKQFTFIDIGGVIQLSDNDSGKYRISDSVASYETQGYKVELIPTILGYTPDDE